MPAIYKQSLPWHGGGTEHITGQVLLPGRQLASHYVGQMSEWQAVTVAQTYITCAPQSSLNKYYAGLYA